MPGGLLPRVPFGRDASPSSSSNSDSRRPSSSQGHSTAPSQQDMERRGSGPQHILESFKGRSIIGITTKHGKDKAEKSHKAKQDENSHQTGKKPARQSAELDIVIESPPNMFYGTKQHSTGALLSGQLHVTVVEPLIVLTSLSMQLKAAVVTKRPVSHGCPKCTSTLANLNSWTFIKERMILQAGQHSFPFSYLLPGHLPATTHGSLGTLDYFLDATADLNIQASTFQSMTQKQHIALQHDMKISRAISPPVERNTLRLFPPTNITARLVFVPVIYPIGSLPLTMRVEGLTEKKTKGHMYERWNLRKVQWRLEERERMVSPACSKHSYKVGGDGKGVQHEEMRIIGTDEIKKGWKNNWDEGTLELEFACQPNAIERPLCDVESPNGFTVAHALVIELVIVEEWAPVKSPGPNGRPTGIARVLKMQFPLVMTERAGLGISWDEEQPPMYDDVPARPPLYPANAESDDSSWVQEVLGMSDDAHSQILDYTGPPLDEPSPLLSSLSSYADRSVPTSPTRETNNLSGWEDMGRLNLGESSASVSESVRADDGVTLNRVVDVNDSEVRNEAVDREVERTLPCASPSGNGEIRTEEGN